MLYIPTGGPSVPTTAPAAPAAALRQAVRGLRADAERRAWATRLVRGAPLRVPALPAPADAADSLVGLLAELSAATTRYVCALRADGARPEQMLVQVKVFVRDALAAEGWHDPDAAQALTAEVVRWSIAAYYDR